MSNEDRADDLAEDIAMERAMEHIDPDSCSQHGFSIAWDAACAYKDKRIAELERYINELKDLLGWTREIHISEGGAE